MSTESPSAFRLFSLVGVAVGILVVLTIAFVDGPSSPTAFRAVVSVHDSMIPPRTAPSDTGAPVLETELDVMHEGVAMHSQMLRWKGRWFSVHLIDGQPDVPPQARTVRASEPQVHAFDVGDLTLVTWLRGDRTMAVASSAHEDQSLQIADMVRPTGRYVPPVTPRPTPPPPAAPPADAPAPAPTPR